MNEKIINVYITEKGYKACLASDDAVFEYGAPYDQAVGSLAMSLLLKDGWTFVSRSNRSQ